MVARLARSGLSDDITVPACPGPDAPPDVTFTFTWSRAFSTGHRRSHHRRTSTAARTRARSRWRSCGSSTTGIGGDRFVGVDRSSLPASRSATPTSVYPVSYTVQPDDAGKVIYDNAVVTVRTQEAQPRQFQGTATSDVAVPLTWGVPGGTRTSASVTAPTSRPTRTTRSCTATRPASSAPGTVPRRTDWYRRNQRSMGRHSSSQFSTASDGSDNPGYNWPVGAAILNNRLRDSRTPATHRPTTHHHARRQRHRRPLTSSTSHDLDRRRPRRRSTTCRQRVRRCHRTARVSSIRIALSSTSIWRRGRSLAACSAS